MNGLGVGVGVEKALLLKPDQDHFPLSVSQLLLLPTLGQVLSLWLQDGCSSSSCLFLYLQIQWSMFLSQTFHCISTLTGLCVHQSLWVGRGHALIGLAELCAPFLEPGIESMLP